ncbi:retrovirus-related pol polyprotein from transposon TNT 1-94 [Tanacetum coccineum]
MINRVYYVEGLNHNLFSVGQLCDADLEVVFQKCTCFVRDLQGNDLLTGNRGTDLYTIYLQDTTSSTPICLMAKAPPTQAWLWHRRLSHLNFDYINLLSKKVVVIGLLKLKYTWTLFLRSKDETPEVLKDFLTMIQRNLQAPVIYVRTDRGTEFLNKTLNAFFKEEGIEHQTSTPRTPEQNGVQLQPHAILKTDQSSSQLMRKWHITSLMTENPQLNTFTSLVALSKGYRVYNKRTRLIVESIHLRFDEIKEMSETSVANDTSGLVPQRQKASDYDNPDPAPELQNVSPSIDATGVGSSFRSFV